MYQLPDEARKWEYENGFYLTADDRRMAKALAHFELLRSVVDVPGAIVECGVFRGASFSRFAMYRKLLGQERSRPMVAFDMFGDFPESSSESDTEARSRFLKETGGDAISSDDLMKSLVKRGLSTDVQLVVGDITETAPKFVSANPELRIALLNIDTDIYDPAIAILEHLYPLVVPGGIVLFDDYGVFPGETQAVEEKLGSVDGRLQRLPYAATPVYMIKD